MKTVSTLLIFAFTSICHGATDGWKWGIGFDHVSNIKTSTTLEILSPKLFGDRREFSLVLAASSQSLNYNILNDDLSVVPVRLMLEIRNPVYKELISSYVRIGAGYSFANDKFIHRDDGYFILPVAIGADIFHYEVNGHYGSIFFQASQDMNFVSSADGMADDLDGIGISIGARIFY